MAVVAWPNTLPSKVNVDSFNYDFGDTTIRSENDVGPAKVRRRSNRPIDMVTMSFTMTKAQYAIFKTFFNVSLAGGVNQFSFVNPLDDTLTNWRISGMPNVRPFGALEWSITFTAERMN